MSHFHIEKPASLKDKVRDLFSQGWPGKQIQKRLDISRDMYNRLMHQIYGNSCPLTAWERVARYEKEKGEPSPARPFLEKNIRRYPKF